MTQLGGDSVQMLKTKEYIEKTDPDACIEVCGYLDVEKKVEKADIVHIFNLQTIELSYSVYVLCKKYKCKVILSPIFWDLKDSMLTSGYFNFFHLKPHGWMKLGRLLQWKLLMTVPLFRNRVGIMGKDWDRAKALLEGVDALLPNSEEELGQLCTIYKLNRKDIKAKSYVIPNAIEVKRCQGKNIEEKLPSGYVLQVGRIGTVKNQVKVLQALKHRKDIPIVFIGRAENEQYYNVCRKLAQKRGNVFFIDSVPHDQIDDYYRKAACHVNPSFRESPGLASMEALYNGIPVVMSEERYCPCGFYRFDKLAYLCDPYSTVSIRKAIYNAIEEPHKKKAGKEYFDFYSYKNVAEMTLRAYREAFR